MKRSIYCYYALVKLHHPLIFYNLFSLFKLLSSLLKKNIYIYIYIYIFSLLVHIYCYIFSNISPPFLPIYFPTTFNFTVTLPSSFCLFYILTLLLPHFILYKFDIISSIQSIFFPKKLWVVSVSLLQWIFVLSYNSE